MKGEILKLLKETAGYISGQELCEKFGVSRTAVWKVINQLKEEGYEIEAVRNKGYILKGSADAPQRKSWKARSTRNGQERRWRSSRRPTPRTMKSAVSRNRARLTETPAARNASSAEGQKRSCLDISGGRWDLDEHALKTTDRSHGGLHADARHGAVHEKGNREGDRIEI
ncbi:MAG: HTH domain-containing protein [Pilosibacter sp.]